MWHNNGGFGNNGPFQNNFSQDGYPPSPFAGQPIQGQQYFSQQPNMTQYEEPNGESFQPEVGLFNDRAYTQNQFNSQGPPQVSVQNDLEAEALVASGFMANWQHV